MTRIVSLRIDRRFPGIGRIAVASGTDRRKEFRERNDLVTRLYRQGRHDLLRAIQAGQVSVAEVFAADREQRLDGLTGERAKLATSLWDAVKAWTPKSAAAEPTRRRYATSFKALERSGVLRASATVAELAAVDWNTLRLSWEGGPSDWNHLRRAVSHFLTMHLGDVHHEFRRTVVKALPKQKETERVPDLPPTLFWKIVNAAPAHARAAYVTIAALGLRVGEYLRLTRDHLLPHSFAVQIPGTKTAESAATARVDERLWPWILQGVPTPLQYKWLRLYWKRALRAAEAPSDLRLHDLRHCFGQWLADAGVQEARIQTGLRHTTAAMTRRYTKQKDKGETALAMANVMLERTA